MPLLVAAVLLMAGTMWAGAGNSSNPKVPFDVNDVVRKASPASRLGIEPGSPLGTSEFVVDTSVAFVPATERQRYPAVASDGTNYLVVWTDYRSGNTWNIYGARVGPSGAVLDSVGMVVSTRANCQHPAIVFDGTNYFVTWDDLGHIYGARVAPTGAVLDPVGIVIKTSASSAHFPAAAFDGTNYLVTWWEAVSGDWDIYGARVTTAGVVLDPASIAISTVAGQQSYPAVAFDGTDYLVVWEDYPRGNIYGARVTTAGVVLDGGPTGGISISNSSGVHQLPAVAFDGVNCFVTWSDRRSGTDDIYGARVTTAGVVLDSAGIAISTATSYQWAPSVAFDGTNYLVAWRDGRNGSTDDIYGARVTTAGAVLDGGPTVGIAISTAFGGQQDPAVAFDGTNYLVVWEDYRNSLTGMYDIYGARVTQAGVVLDGGPTAGIAISTGANNQYYPAVAFDGTNYMVVWQDLRNGSTHDIYGVRVSRAGAMLDAASFAISTATYDQIRPSVAFDGTNYLVVWQDYRGGSNHDVYGARVTPAGTVLDASGIAISTAANNQHSPAVAFDGTNYLAVWEDGRTGNWDIYGARVRPSDGYVLDAAGIQICVLTSNQHNPAAAFDGTNYLVVWQDARNGGSNFDTYGARLNRAGTVLDASGIQVTSAANNQLEPGVCFDGTNYLAAWQDYRNGTASGDIYAARVSTAGAVLDASGIAVSTAPNDQGAVSVARDGVGSTILWQDYRSGSTWDICAARVTTAGSVVDSVVVSRQSASRQFPALACGSGGQLFAVYHGLTGRIGARTASAVRILGRLL